MAASPWPAIHAQRHALADDLGTLSQDQWKTPSPEVTGPALSLVLAMTGRAGALADLSGDGLPVLGSRMPANQAIA